MSSILTERVIINCRVVLCSAEVSMWDSDDVCDWLEELDLGDYCQNFREHEVDGKQLLNLNMSDWQVCTPFYNSRIIMYHNLTSMITIAYVVDAIIIS